MLEVNKMKNLKHFEDASLELVLFGSDVLTTSDGSDTFYGDKNPGTENDPTYATSSGNTETLWL